MSRRILIIEDNATLAQGLRSNLEYRRARPIRLYLQPLWRARSDRADFALYSGGNHRSAGRLYAL